MIKDTWQILTGEVQLSMLEKIYTLRKTVWPNFIRLPEETLFELYRLYPGFQICIVDQLTGTLIAIANSVPLSWKKDFSSLSQRGVSWVLETALDKTGDISLANVLCAISITVDSAYRGQMVSKYLLTYLKQLAYLNKMSHLIVPVRPTLKPLYPLIPIHTYLRWKNADGLPFDPWLRVHVQLGAKLIKICQRSAQVIAPIEQWEHWTDMRFPADGLYVIKHALVPITIESKKNKGIYIEPNIWVGYVL